LSREVGFIDGGKDLPVDVFGIEDLAKTFLICRCFDGCPAKVRCHCKVGDGTDEEGDGEEVVEDFLAGFGEVRQGDDTEKGEAIDGTNGPEPIRAINAEVEVAPCGGIDLKGIVATCDKERHLDEGLRTNN
jgi:hypothetical protein